MKTRIINISIFLLVVILTVIFVIFNKIKPENDYLSYEHEIQEIPEVFIKELRLNQINETLGVNKPILVYRYTTDVCNSCLHEDLYELSKWLDHLGKQNVMVLPAYPHNRDTRIRLHNELAKFNYKNISSDSVVIPFDKDGNSKRYFALISENGEPELIFFPESGKTELTDFFLKRVQKKIKNNKD